MATGTIKMRAYQSGTDSIWKYRKYEDGTYHAWYEGAVNLEAGNSFGVAGLYYHQTTSDLAPPSFSTSVTSFTGAANSAVITAYLGHTAAYRSYWLNAVATAVNNVAVRLDMYGTW